MKTFYVLVLTAVISLLPVNCLCNTLEPPRPLPDGETYNCTTACENLRKINCSDGYVDGNGLTCEDLCVLSLELTDVPLECLSNAKMPSEAVGCGWVLCE